MNGTLVRNIRWVVLSQMNRMGLANTEYARMEQFAFECYMDELKLRAMPGVEVYRDTVNSVGVIPFPPGYVKYTKIGVEFGGRIQTLTLDTDLMFKKPTICGEITEQSSDQYCFVPHLYNGTMIDGLYTYGGGISSEGVYRVDETKRQFQVNPRFSGKEIIIEYVSNGVAQGSTIVPPFFIDAMRYYMGWKYFEYIPGQEQRAQLEYQRFADYVVDGALQEQMPTMEELLDTLYQNAGYEF